MLDDNFESVMNSVKWGRNIYASTRKFLQFQLTVNIVAICVSIIGGITVESSPLSAVQMLWVNLIMDTFAALALATEAPSKDDVESKPYGRSEKIITQDMIISIVSQSIYQIIILLVILFYGPTLFDIEAGWGNNSWNEDNGLHFTIFFNVFVMLQLFNEIGCRKILLSEINIFKGIFSNWMFIFILCGTFIIQISIVEIGGKPLRCTHLPDKYHLLSIGLGLSCLVYGILLRVIVTWYRRRGAIKSYTKENYNNSEENIKEDALLLDN